MKLHRRVWRSAPDDVAIVPSGVKSTESLSESEEFYLLEIPSGRVCAPDDMDDAPDDMNMSRPVYSSAIRKSLEFVSCPVRRKGSPVWDSDADSIFFSEFYHFESEFGEAFF